MNDTVWYRVLEDIPRINATAGNLVMVDRDPRDMWVCQRHDPFDLIEYGSSLERCAEDETPTPTVPQSAECEQLMPMEAFDAMAGALRPLVSGLADFETGWGGYSCFVDESGEGCELTPEGVHRIDEMARSQPQRPYA